MLTLRRILFPTDYGPCADRAFAHAVFLGERHGAELHVLHVAPVVGFQDTPPPPPYPVPSTVKRVDVTERSGSAAESILTYADEVDLVVMGTHGRRGVARMAVGSTTEQVMRAAECPVFAVGLDAERSAPAFVERILVPVDFSDSSGPALAIAGELAALYDARVDALHAVSIPTLPAIYGLGIQLSVNYPEVVSRTRQTLDSLVRQHVALDHIGEITVQVGPPGPTILAEAERLDAGLLVMPTHGRTGLDRLAYGSVAEQVLRRAPCPVFSLKSYGRIPLPDDAGVDLPVSTVSLDLEQELGDALANHDA